MVPAPSRVDGEQMHMMFSRCGNRVGAVFASKATWINEPCGQSGEKCASTEMQSIVKS
jgi:hypothetical protein